MSFSSSGEWMGPCRTLREPKIRSTDPAAALMPKSQRFRNQLAQDNVQASDQDEGDADGDPVGVNVGMRNLAEKFLNHVGQQRFANPAEGKANYCDSKLNAVNHFIEIAVQFLDDAGADSSGLDELLDAGFANAYQGEFGRGKERVGCDQEQDQKHPDQHKSDHGLPILTFQRQFRIPRDVRRL
jgi:hypothetical protein